MPPTTGWRSKARSRSPRTDGEEAGMTRRLAHGVLLVMAIAAASAAHAQSGSRLRETALEETIRDARQDLPRQGQRFGQAASELARQDPKRGAALVREMLARVKPGQWSNESGEYYLIHMPFEA